LSGAQKSQHLIAQVKGEPELQLQSTAITDADDFEAWNLLNEGYQDKIDLVNATLKRLFALQTIHRESAAAMRRFLDTTVECVRYFEVMERPVDTWGGCNHC
jgi:hypothetical protein